MTEQEARERAVEILFRVYIVSPTLVLEFMQGLIKAYEDGAKSCKLKVYGSDACISCDDKRITLYYDGSLECISCRGTQND